MLKLTKPNYEEIYATHYSNIYRDIIDKLNRVKNDPALKTKKIIFVFYLYYILTYFELFFLLNNRLTDINTHNNVRNRFLFFII